MNFSVIPTNLSSKATKIGVIIQNVVYGPKEYLIGDYSALRHIMPIFVVFLDELVGITLKFIH